MKYVSIALSHGYCKIAIVCLLLHDSVGVSTVCTVALVYVYNCSTVRYYVLCLYIRYCGMIFISDKTRVNMSMLKLRLFALSMSII